MFLVQHGYGTGAGPGKVAAALAAGDADGVIWSTGEYAPSSLEAQLRRNAGAEQMLDPQIYAAYAPGPVSWKQLRSYPWIAASRQGNRQAAVVPPLIRAVTAAALDYQRDQAELTAVIGPSTSTSVATGARLAAVVAFAAESVRWWRQNGDDRPLFISVPIEGELLDIDQSVHALFGAISRVGASGFYVLAELTPTLDETTYTARLERALWLTHRLAAVAPVRVGYAGLSGWLYRAAGAEATASGWYQNRRWWSPSHWRKRTGGSWRGRAALEPVLALLPPGDLAAIRDADLALYEQVVGGVGPLAAALRANPARAGRAITLDEEAAQLFAICRALDNQTGVDLQTDGRRILQRLAAINTLRGQVAVAAVTIAGAATDSRPSDWETALRRLAARLGVRL